MNKLISRSATILILFFGIESSFGQTVSDEAKRYFSRGVAAVEMAKSPTDYEMAIREFRQAATLAPDWPDVYYNLGLVQEKAEKFNDAVTSLKQYIRLAPNSADAETVKTLIYKLEYKREQEDGAKKIYEMMSWPTNILVIPHVIWKKTGEKGDKESDWEIEHNSDFSAGYAPDQFRRSVFEMKDGTLYKNHCDVAPMKLYLRSTIYTNIPVKVNGKYFEYRYPTEMIWVVEYTKNGIPIYDHQRGGELSIKGEILSMDPPRVKREQTVKWPDGRTSVTEFVYELSAKSADLNDNDKTGKTPIANDLNINEKDNFGNTPLHNAATNGQKDEAELLIAKGADINAKNQLGWTPLHAAASLGKMAVVELLITRGADINATDKSFGTPMQYAEFNKHKEVAELLRKHGGK